MKRSIPSLGAVFFWLGTGLCLPMHSGGLSAPEDFSAAVSRAQNLLSARKGFLQELKNEYPTVDTALSGKEHRFEIPSRLLFSAELSGLGPEADRLLKVLKNYLMTFRNPHLVVLIDQPPAASFSEVQKSNDRAIMLGLYFFRECGLAPERLSIRSRPSEDRLVRVSFWTVAPPSSAGAEQDVQGVMVNLRNRLFDLDSSPRLDMEITLLDPSRVRNWILKILDADGAAIREFSGASDLYVPLSWDGRDKKGELIRPGEYQLFLTASNYASEDVTDSLGFIVKKSTSSVAVLPKKSAQKSVAKAEKWAYVARFRSNESLIDGPALAAVKQLAENVSAFPGQRISVEGFADLRERNARQLAEERARNVALMLEKKYGVSGGRMTIRAHEPRDTLPGEMLQKAVVFFVE